jgi:hypothetical protein
MEDSPFDKLTVAQVVKKMFTFMECTAPSMVSICSHMHPVHTFLPHFFNCNVILPYMGQVFPFISPSSRACYIPNKSYL